MLHSSFMIDKINFLSIIWLNRWIWCFIHSVLSPLLLGGSRAGARLGGGELFYYPRWGRLKGEDKNTKFPRGEGNFHDAKLFSTPIFSISLFLSKLLHRTYRHTYILSSWSGLSIVGMGVDTPGQRSLPEKPNQKLVFYNPNWLQ